MEDVVGLMRVEGDVGPKTSGPVYKPSTTTDHCYLVSQRKILTREIGTDGLAN